VRRSRALAIGRAPAGTLEWVGCVEVSSRRGPVTREPGGEVYVVPMSAGDSQTGRREDEGGEWGERAGKIAKDAPDPPEVQTEPPSAPRSSGSGNDVESEQ
jgi:hypothetical protein